MKKTKKIKDNSPITVKRPIIKRSQTIALEDIEFSKKQVLSVSDITSGMDPSEIWDSDNGGIVVKIPTRIRYNIINIELDIKKKKFDKLFKLFGENKQVKMFYVLKNGKRIFRWLINGYMESIDVKEDYFDTEKQIIQFSIIPNTLTRI